MKIMTADRKEVETKATRDQNMEMSIVDTMRRYFQSDTGRPRADLEYAIMDAVKCYFECPKQ